MLLICLIYFLHPAGKLWSQPAIQDSLYFGKIEILNERSEIQPDKITSNYRSEKVTRKNYNNLTGAILYKLQNRGYYFAILNLSNTNITTSGDSIFLNPEFALNYNQKAVIDTFYFEGLSKTDPVLLNRKLRYYKSQVLNKNLLEQVKRQIKSFRFLEINGEEEIVSNKNNDFGLLFRLKEKNTNRFQGIAGYVPGKGAEKGYFTGKFDIQLSNLGGRGRQLNLNWSRLNNNSQEFHINYATPWIWKYNYSGQMSFDQTLRDTILVTRKFNGSIGKQLTSSMELSLNLEYESHLPTLSGKEIYELDSRNNTYLGTGIKIDTRESIYNPRSGGTLNSDLLVGKSNQSNADNFSLRLNFSSSYNYELMNNFVINSGLNLRGKWNREVASDFTDYFWFGGSESMRGYAEDFFRGTRIGWASFELRWLQGLYSRLYLFYERGYFFFRENGEIFQDFPASFGAGIRLNSRAGIIGLDYAFDEDDSFTTAKIHIRFINRF